MLINLYIFPSKKEEKKSNIFLSFLPSPYHIYPTEKEKKKVLDLTILHHNSFISFSTTPRTNGNVASSVPRYCINNW